VADAAYRGKLAARRRPKDLVADIRGRMFEPVYRDYV
jgi:hypothetical protein